MSKKKIRRLSKEYYVTDAYGHTDKVIVDKVNELVEKVNQLQEENIKLKLLLGGKK
jgi:hypothetical protein